jgi:hypothetical protein
MTTPTNRTPIRVARGTRADLLAGIAALAEGEVVYAEDEGSLYVKQLNSGGMASLVAVRPPGLVIPPSPLSLRGYIDVTIAGSAPTGPLSGDMVLVTKPGVVAAGWGSLSGTSVKVNDLIYWDVLRPGWANSGNAFGYNATATPRGVQSLTVQKPLDNRGTANDPALVVLEATATEPGLMSGADKTKLDGLGAQAQADWDEASNVAVTFIKNKPGAATATELGLVKPDGVTVAISADGTLFLAARMMNFVGAVDVTKAPPKAYRVGDVLVATVTGVADVGWRGIAGRAISAGSTVVYDGSDWYGPDRPPPSVSQVLPTLPVEVTTAGDTVKIGVKVATTASSGVVQLADAAAIQARDANHVVTAAQLADVADVAANEANAASLAAALADNKAVAAHHAADVADNKAVAAQAAATAADGKAVAAQVTATAAETRAAAATTAAAQAQIVANNALPKAGGQLTGDVSNTATGFLELPEGSTSERPSTPSSGMLRYNNELKQFEGFKDGEWGGVGAGAGANLLINPAFRINQRGYVSGAATVAANQYTLDRWRVNVSGQSLSWGRSNNTTVVTVPAGGISQIVEGINLLDGQYVLDWQGTATATAGGVAVAKGVPFAVMGSADLTIAFGAGTLSFAKLEQGTQPTPFKLRPIDVELAMCQRYFFAGTMRAELNPLAVTANIATVTTYPVTMRVAPTVVGTGNLGPSPNGHSAMNNTAGNSWAPATPYTASAEL